MLKIVSMTMLGTLPGMYIVVLQHVQVKFRKEIVLIIDFQKEKNAWGGKYLELAKHEVLCNFLEGVVHCTLLISEHQASVEVSS